MQDATGGRWQLVGCCLALSSATTTTGVLAIYGSPDAFPRVTITALALIILLGVAQPARRAARLVALFVAALHLISLVHREPELLGMALPRQPMIFVAGAAAAIGLVLAGRVADAYGRACKQYEDARNLLRQRVDALRPSDPVTNVATWSHAQLVFERELARAQRYTRPLALLRVVIDQWDVVRTRLGSRKADEVLAAVGAHLRESTRVVDVVAYHGDATFDILLPDTPGAGARVVAERVAELRSPHPGVRLRVGVAQLSARTCSLDRLLQQGALAVSIAEQLNRPFAVCAVESTPGDWARARAS